MEFVESFLPQDRRRALAISASLPEQADGALLFADISGFTPLTEAMSQALGARHGAEEMTRQLNRVYDALVAEIERYGGSVISFSGDAVTCWFETAEGASPASFAVRCAFALQDAMGQFGTVVLPDGSTTAIGLKVAVASGTARRLVAGDPAIRLIDVLAGSPVARAAGAEHLAQRGEILVDEPTARELGERLELVEWRADNTTGDRFAVVKNFERSPEPIPVPAPPPLSATLSSHSDEDTIPPAAVETPADADALARWLHAPLTSRHRLDQGEFLTELRPVVAMFVRFAGIDFDDDSLANGEQDAGHKLNGLIAHAQQLLEQYQGTLLELTVGDKGSYFYAAFGAFAVHEDDARRAVYAALDLLALPPELEWAALQIGISQGIMRVGPYGSQTRRNFGAQGDEVNLAARLMMQAAPGQLIVSGRVVQGLGPEFDLEPQPPIRLKGKAEPLLPFIVRGVSESHSVRLQAAPPTLPLVGREGELAQIMDRLALARPGHGQIVGVVGEAGMGKSRLASEVLNRARRAGWQTYSGECQSLSRHTAYRVWVPIWRALFGVDARAPLRRTLHALADELQALAPGRSDALPLLGTVLDLALPENDFTRALEPRFRKSTLEAMLTECLCAAAQEAATQGQALLLMLDDLHWIDPGSADLLERVASSIQDLPVLLLLAYRPTDPSEPGARRVVSLGGFTEIELSELDASQAEALVRARLSQLAPENPAAVPPELIRRITARAQGNPFYIQELLNYMHDRGLNVRDPGALDGLDLPGSLHRLLLSRIDRLAQEPQLALKAASIIGRAFTLAQLSGYMPRLGPVEAVQESLQRLQQSDLVLLEEPDPEPGYVFKHIVTQQVAYESMSFATRERLHEQYAQFVETHTAPERNLDLLAYHYDHSANTGKRREYLYRAGQAAAAQFVNAQALDYISRALSITPDGEPVTRYELLAARERVLDVQGERERQRQDLAELERLAAKTDDSEKRLTTVIRQGWLAERVADYRAAVEHAQQAIAAAHAGAESVPAPLEPDTRLLGEAHALWGQALWRQGDARAAQPYVEQALAFARRAGDRAGEAWALDRLGTLARDLGNNAAARDYHRQALDLAQAIGDRRRESMALNNLAAISILQGDPEHARQDYTRALQIVRQIGDRQGEALLLSNLLSVHVALGEYDRAEGDAEQALQVARAIDDRQTERRSLANLGEIYRLVGDYGAARSHGERALAMAREQADQLGQEFGLMNLAALALDMGDDEEARRHVGAGLPIARAINHAEGEAFLLNVLGAVQSGAGQSEEAQATFEQALGIWQALDPSPFILQAHAGLAELAGQSPLAHLAEPADRAGLHDARLGQAGAGAEADGAQAAEHVNAILDYVERHPTQAGDPAALAALWSCYRVLRAGDDPRAPDVLRTARELLTERASRIQDPARRQSFLQNVRAHRAIMDAGT